ncbi:MIP/aquaporin family protein [Streptococcus dysgalactiae]|uniref:MIP/aquaporin family protein n=1 Tax=Streptococcus dysgalactiae TaxID=1334 RepID=UPI0001F86593|nr:MIP/aquaporin family protein [Streptococcus dysgalactiae]EFY03358.1 glycerol uptake facilitator protein [Streptococcus dysgalactiae subsp. dysgalactiae ATCC 27957]MCB2829139.1 aquaporin family protein [Streptococcus dysgalactiae subsp. dysgalactiae]MCB2831559.1 aquaporin family protein [Streptococcus dysgalactiae subsp. dysgalactiae]MCB2835268.1 aquaporin family protein [Streptococcus dysgalactiae subsp. dysgalactiae]MCB2837374.1 aquaporin family protein [Streptococcus dysgalactiae subsp. d
MDIFGEFLGTALLVLLGNGVVAGVVLPKTKNHASGWIVIATGWGIAVAVAAFISGKIAPAHLNPAVSLAFAMKGTIAWPTAIVYSLAQMLGAMLGSVLVFLQFRPHYVAADNPADILGTFATGPAIRDNSSNLLSEIFGTFVLVLGILAFGLYDMPAGLGTLCVGLLVIGIGLSLGGTTGYAINPARDLGPRMIHAILPIKNKGDSAWSYAWIPIVGPMIGAALAVLLFQIMS